MTDVKITIPANLLVPGDTEASPHFEENYIALRRKEQRLYSDEEVLKLPDVASHHPHHLEWLLRKKATDKLLQWMQKKQQSLQVLEVGCGNGWLAAQLATVSDSHVIGCDINFTELQQATAVFHTIPHLHFMYGDIRSGLFKESSFDCIIFAASIQYFPSLPEIINSALVLLKPGGELHILDSPFYKEADIPAAQKRTAAYYNSLGFSNMASYYFHHSMTSLRDFDYELLYNPASPVYFFSKHKNPFPWICIRPAAVYV